MLLTIDIGNTTIRAGVFDGPRLHATWAGPTRGGSACAELTAWLDAVGPVEAAVGSCVVPALRWDSVAGLAVRWAGAGLAVPLRQQYQPPEALGTDRALTALAAGALCGAPAVVAGCGTATTLDAVRADGSFAGGAILCGLATARDALAQRTALLPAVDLVAPGRALGESTVECLQVGLVLGHCGAIAWLAQRLREELGAPDAPLIGTGGLATLLASAAPGLFTAVDEHLVLHGLRLCCEREQQ